MDLLQNLGIHGKLLVAQIINFIILWLVLKRFVYAPLMKVMEERRAKIKEGLRKAEEAEKKMELIKEKEKKILKKARREAEKIVERAEKQAKINRELILKKARREAEKKMEEAQAEIKDEKKKMLREAKSEIAELIFLAVKKIIGNEVNQKDSQIIKRIIEKGG